MKNNSKKDNWLALLRLVIFSMIFISIFYVLEVKLHENSFRHPTWTYAANPDNEPIDVLFVGNSHTYTSIDAEVISLATDLNVRSLTCSSINGEVVAADLEAFLNYSVPKVVVIEMCPFTVDNFEEMRTSKVGIVLEHFDAIPNITTRAEAISQITDFENIPAGTFQLLRNTSMWSRWAQTEPDLQGYDLYGTKQRFAVYWDSTYNASTIKELTENYIPDTDDECMNERNRQALNKILELSEIYGFEVWVYNAPLSKFNKSYANSLNYVYSIQDKYSNLKYIDDSMLHLEDIGITYTDFFDSGHLNINGMQKTTIWMLDKIATRFDVTANTSDIVRYYNTNITLLGDNLFKYEINTYCDAQYQFKYTDIDGNKVTTDWSTDNYFIAPAISTDKIRVNIKAINDDNSEILTYRFLPYTLYGFEVNTISDEKFEIINSCNYNDELQFGWSLTNLTDNSVITYDYTTSNSIIIEPQSSGTYSVSASTLLPSGHMQQSENILTFTYDQDLKQITIEQTIDSITVN